MNEKYLEYVKGKLEGNFDVKYRELKVNKGIIRLIFIDNLCDSKFISQYIAAPIIKSTNIVDGDTVKEEILEANSIGNVKSQDDALIHILSGDVIIISNFYEEIIFCEAKGFVRRSVSIPITENVVKGPREGFTEASVDNVSMIRRKIKNPDLKFETGYLGKKSNTVVVISYIKGVVPESLVKYVKAQLNSVEEDFILESNYIEEKIRCKSTAFDSVGYSEKPDVIASKLFEGRVAIIVDGTPFVMSVPYFFIENFQMPDDYYFNKYISNLTRVFRLIGFAIAMFLPGIYIALTTYHFSLIPQAFVFRLAVARAGVPFPTIVELIVMSFFFQILREAGVRLPQPVGQAMSIVGALILGDAAVGAGLASQGTLIIVALSSISSFLVSKLYGAITIWSLVITLFSATLGLPGFYIGFFVLVSHLGGLNSCGYAYLFPVGTSKSFKYKDLLSRGYLNEISNTIFDKGEK
ncbi:MAG: spore germination protein [Clostridiaceae bacterium]|nr:spore germination protein [Clostridiaceae bacterium]